MASKVEGSSKKKRVLVVGAGAAGMSCAHHLAEHPDRFDVTLVDTNDYCGGQAFSIDIDKERHGASWLNQGVQGGAYIFHHTLTMFSRMGHHADPVDLHVSFGKGDQFWTNVYPTKLLERHQKEVKRFATMIKFTRMFEVFFALLPIKYLVKLWGFSTEFANVVALPMVALFLGTGNWTPEVPSIMLERLVTSPTYGMWYPSDKESVTAKIPPMVVFPNFTDFYDDWRKSLVKRGVDVRLSTQVAEVVKRDRYGVTVLVKKLGGDDEPDSAATEEKYDEIVLCTLADAAKKILGRSASFREKKVLGSAKFADDITVTHWDSDYMKKNYENFYNAEQAVTSLSGVDQTARVEKAKENFKPMYYIKMYQQDLTKLEMCFDCSNYQSQFPPEVPFDKHVFQTIFLNKQRDGHLWSIDDIDESKIIRKDWWHQLCHSFTHYIFLVPWMWALQGRKHTRFAGSWTLVNAHEVAVISGIAAAVNLGAKYPEDLERDKFALLAFRLYYLLTYFKWYKKQAPADGPGKDWGSGLYGADYKGPGASGEERLTWKKEVEAGRSLKSL